MSDRILFAFYDLSVSPVSFDFSSFVVCADVQRAQTGHDRIHFVIVPPAGGPGHWDNKLHADAQLSWRLSNVVLPLTRLIAAPTSFTICGTRTEARRLHDGAGTENVFPEKYTLDAPIEQHHTGWSVILAHRGADLQRIRASEQARAYARQWINARADGRKVVAITLREAPFLPARNSDPAVWGAFARALGERGFLPVVLRDMDTALGPSHPAFDGIDTFAEGVLNLELRMAFYEEAHIHASVANGPVHVCFYDRNVRYLYVVTGDWLRDEPTPFGRMGIQRGETPPFANRYQRWVWEEQTPEMLLAHFTALHGDIASDQAAGRYEAGLDAVAQRRLPIADIAQRFEAWTRLTYGTTAEEIRLMMACRGDEPHSEQSERERIKTQVSLAIAASDLDKAVALLRRMGDKLGYQADDHVQLGMLFEARGENALAAQHYRQALDEGGDDPALVYRLGTAASAAGNLAEARDCFERLVARGVRHSELFAQLSGIYERQDEPELAAALRARAGASTP